MLNHRETMRGLLRRTLPRQQCTATTQATPGPNPGTQPMLEKST